MIKFNLNVLIAEHEQRTDRRWSYEALSEAIGLNKNTINSIAANRSRRIDLHTIDALCEFFDCEPGDILVRVNHE